MSADRDSLSDRDECEPDLLGSLWRDEHGHTYRVFNIRGADGADPALALSYVPPVRVKSLSLGELRASHNVVRGQG